MIVEQLCPKSAKHCQSTRYFHVERISHWLIASLPIIEMMMMQVEDYFQEEEEKEEYDFWADYADYSDEDGQTNQVCLFNLIIVVLVVIVFLVTIIIALKLF